MKRRLVKSSCVSCGARIRQHTDDTTQIKRYCSAACAQTTNRKRGKRALPRNLARVVDQLEDMDRE